MRILNIIIIAVCLAFSLGFSKAYSPKVLTQHVADLSGDWQNFLNYKDFNGKTGQALAEAIFTYITDTITGYYHSIDVRGEYSGWADISIRNQQAAVSNYSERVAYWLTFDPVQAYNNHGYGLCFHNSPTFGGLMMALGFENVRCGSMGGWHNFGEVYWDGDWHYFDTDQRGYVKTATGEIPSWIELSQNPSLIDQNPHNLSPYFPYPPFDDAPGTLARFEIKAMADTTRTSSPNTFHETLTAPYHLCHSMDYTLRRGEKIRRYWQSDSGRLYIAQEQYDTSAAAGGYWSQVAKDYFANFNKDPYGPKPYHGGLSGSMHTTGMGMINYSPDLTNMSADYADGVYEDSNMTQLDSGVFLNNDGDGYIIFKNYSPYVIIAKANNVMVHNDDTDGALIKYRTTGNTEVLISKDYGLSWSRIRNGGNLDTQEDLSTQMYGRYGYLVKFKFSGTSQKAGLKLFETKTLIAVAPMSLPVLKTGSNSITYTTGDVRGNNTEAINMHVDISDSAAANKMIVSNTTTYQPYILKPKMSGGDVVFKVKGPVNSKMKWISAGANVQGGWGQSYDYRISVSSDNSTYTQIGTYQTTNERHWNSTMNTTGDLTSYSDELYVKFHSPGGSAGFNRILIYAHYDDGTSKGSDPATVTYGYEEGGTGKTFSFTAYGDTTVNLTVGSVKNKWVEIGVPNSSALSNRKGLKELMKKHGFHMDAYPNPFSTGLKIEVISNKSISAGDVRIEIYDISGKFIDKLDAGIITPAQGLDITRYSWNSVGRASGIYIVKARLGRVVLTRKMTLLK
jgi:hypothetical protein